MKKYILQMTMTSLILISGCENQSQPEFLRSAPRSPTSTWLVADLRALSQFPPLPLSTKEQTKNATNAGCDVIALTDHSRMLTDGTTTSSYLSDLNKLRQRHPKLLIIGGIEWNIPPYQDQQSINLLLDATSKRSVFSSLQKQFNNAIESSQREKNNPRSILEGLRGQNSLLSEAVLFYTPPSRNDITQRHALIIGLESDSLHQPADIIAAYKQRLQTKVRKESKLAATVGTWDQLLDQGIDVWTALTDSNDQSQRPDSLPCAFSRTHIQVTEKSISGVLQGLKAGTFWSDYGRILNKLVVTLKSPGLSPAARPGDKITLGAQQPIAINVFIERDQAALNSPLIAELVSNCRTGIPALIDSQAINVGQNAASWAIIKPQPGGDGKSCYLRTRVRLQDPNQSDFMAYSNPIRISFVQPGWFAGNSKQHNSSTKTHKQSAPAYANTYKNTSDQPPLGKNQKLPPLLLLVIILIFLLFIIGVLINVYRPKFFSNLKNKLNAPETIQYVSQISLCSLIFDAFNNVLRVSYGKKISEINFSDIAGFEVALNNNGLMKISSDSKQSFDAETEENLLIALSNVEHDKLAEDETRQITLEIFSTPDSNLEPVLINFYYREGDHRLSSHSFSRSVEDVIYWCSLLESAIRPESVLEPEAFEEETKVAIEDTPAPEIATPEAIIHSSPVDLEAAIISAPEPVTPSNSFDLADELTKLADLKAKGFLSDQEFQIAKEKILNYR